jgi:2Fe-2S ferredoxin
MPEITLVGFDGRRYSIDAEIGKSLMQNALDNGVPGIDADCGGACACGTCHCFVDEPWRALAGEASAAEEAMLGMRPDRGAGSRLSCQIRITGELDGMVVHLPEFQM